MRDKSTLMRFEHKSEYITKLTGTIVRTISMTTMGKYLAVVVVVAIDYLFEVEVTKIVFKNRGWGFQSLF